MTLDCETLKAHLSAFSLMRHCDIVKDKSLRIATPFQYPDGSLIDVFLEGDSELWETLELSDKGQTTSYLLDLQVKHWTTLRRKTIVADICKTLGVKHEGGVFKISFPAADIGSVSDYLVRLAQACIRVTDVSFTQRLRSQTLFFEDVEEFLSSIPVEYKTSPVLTGKFGKLIELDFSVRGKMVNSLIQTVSTSSSTTHYLLNEVFTRWYDLGHLRRDHQCITLYDSSCENIRPDDISRLSEVSEVIAFPLEQDRLKESIAA